jgi:hypothetical protein
MSEKTASTPAFSISLGDCIFLGSNLIIFIFSFLRWVGNDVISFNLFGMDSRGWMTFVACILCIILVLLKCVIAQFMSDKQLKLLARAPWYLSVFMFISVAVDTPAEKKAE